MDRHKAQAFTWAMLLVLGVGLAAAQTPPSAGAELTAADIVRMLRAGVSEDLVVAVVKKHGKPMHLTAEEIIELKASSATDNLVTLLLNPDAEAKPAAPALPATAPAPTPADPAPDPQRPPAPASPQQPPAPAEGPAPASPRAVVGTLTEGYRKFSIDENVGAVFPQGEMRQWYWRNPDGSRQRLFKPVFLGGTHLGYRPIRYVQIDAGFDLGLNVTGKRRVSVSRFGENDLADLILLLPLGARGVAPLFDQRLLISGGGGGSWVTNVQYRGQPNRRTVQPVQLAPRLGSLRDHPGALRFRREPPYRARSNRAVDTGEAESRLAAGLRSQGRPR